jgi:hypothetical protein
MPEIHGNAPIARITRVSTAINSKQRISIEKTEIVVAGAGFLTTRRHRLGRDPAKSTASKRPLRQLSKRGLDLDFSNIRRRSALRRAA